MRRIPDLNPKPGDGQSILFNLWRFHAFFTTGDPAIADTVSADTVSADKTTAVTRSSNKSTLI